jgi:hypothetical protein
MADARVQRQSRVRDGRGVLLGGGRADDRIILPVRDQDRLAEARQQCRR